MYRISARQIILIALVSAIFAAGAVAVVDRFAGRFQPTSAAFSEKAPASITDPTVATDEQNNIEIYRALSSGVVNVHSTSYARDFFGFVEPTEGSGSGSIIDAEGDILTNYHVIENAQKLSVSLGGQKDYPAKLIGGDPDTDLAVIRLLDRPHETLTVDHRRHQRTATAHSWSQQSSHRRSNPNGRFNQSGKLGWSFA